MKLLIMSALPSSICIAVNVQQRKKTNALFKIVVLTI